ncbi:MAG TPA: hypothetical protein PKE63_02700 [Lacibacter sp.]|nr:hypothetical protein [Lacibacter sp.]HMO88241.1 hypothetical protein [Lacibacter sp.]HMP86156.1 hypothetical protein [Lacibacter sp.]
MYLHIHDTRTLKELQEDFNFSFPYLRLEFFSRMHRSGLRSSLKRRLNPFLQVATVRSKHRNGALEINGNQKVRDVEQSLQQDYHLPVQIYHFTKAGWLMTDVTDDATLDELNEQGRNTSHELHNVFAQARNLH